MKGSVAGVENCEIRDFVAIDFETANYDSFSACSVGLVKCVGGEIVETYSTLIRPPRLYFVPKFTQIHGLTAEDVQYALTFDKHWEFPLRDFLGDYPLVAHNARFDRSVLLGTLGFYELPMIENPWECTLQHSRRYFSRVLKHTLPNYRLNTVAAYWGISFQHHDALQDALAAAEIWLRIQREER
ncbi:MAG: 3'-5' exonuclease [Planctomycetia bacterium]|nr:3'-5' exonuclease [Planctomycetia bacterium]